MGLAEEKKKQKIQVDPNNTHWARDKSKFGYKLMQKMGWNEGEGLGINGNGITTNIKIVKKDDNIGIGADKRTIDNWLDNTSAFEELLKNLNNEVKVEITTSESQSCENNKIKNKIHRKKFIQAKGRVLENKEDLSDILGIKRKTRIEETDEQVNSFCSTDVPLVNSALSANDYFKKKLKELGNKQKIEEPPSLPKKKADKERKEERKKEKKRKKQKQ